MFVIFVVEKQTTKYLFSKIKLDAMCHVHSCIHVVAQSSASLRFSMALFRYFKREQNNLPDPHGPFVQSVLSSSIAAANSLLRLTRQTR